MSESFDVLIVGAGPAGLATACRCAPNNNVLVVHKDAEIGVPVRTSGGSWLKDVQELQIPSNCYHIINSLVFAGPTTQSSFTFKRHTPVVLDVTGTYRHFARLAEVAGTHLETSTKLTGITKNMKLGYLCDLEHKGITRQVTARYVVDASGFQRAVISKMVSIPKPARYGIGAEAECVDNSSHTRRAVLFVGSKYAPGGYGWIFPTAQGTVRIGIGITRPNISQSPGKLLDDFLKSSVASQLGLNLGKVLDHHGGVVPAVGPLDKLVFDGILAVGDSAGQVLATVGEGIRFCLESGLRAGDALAKALQNNRGDTGTVELMQYESWWRKTHLEQFKRAQSVNERITDFTDEQWDAGIARISNVDGDIVAALLRAENVTLALTRAVLKHPELAIKYLKYKLRR